MIDKIYLDNAATTVVSEEVVDAMMPYFTDIYGNPGSIHSIGAQARKAVDDARETVAGFMGCDPENIIFTSGGSEANSIMIRGFKGSGRKIYSAVEHPSVIKSMRDLWHSVCWPVNPNGTIDLTGLSETLAEDDVDFLAVMTANNEVGAINDIKYLSDLCKDKGVWLHTDCVQAAGCVGLDAKQTDVDSMSISSHKIHGPKGVGALYVKDFSMINTFTYGGQEHNIRGGTENVPGIIGFAKACEICQRDFDYTLHKILSRKNMMVDRLTRLADINGIQDRLKFNGDIENSSKVVNFRIDGVDGQTLLMMMDALGVMASAGSACTSREMHPSHVLKAIGLTAEQAYNSVRISFSRYNTNEEVDRAANIIINSAVHLLNMKKEV